MQLHHYQLIEPLGKGGMGSVFKARKISSGEIVAIKFMPKELARDPILLQRFKQEFDICHRLRHPSIVHSHEFGVENGIHYLVMDYIAGYHLGKYVRKSGKLSINESLRFIRMLADALLNLHENNIIHRDVKPDNILITPKHELILTDLGLMKDLVSDGNLTQSGTTLGSLFFMAPEQYEDARTADIRSDIYSAGGTLYFCLTGTSPFRAKGNIFILKKKFNNDFVKPSNLLVDFPPELEELICRCLQADPNLRFANFSEFIEALDQLESKGIVDFDDNTSPTLPEISIPEEDSDSERRRADRYATQVEARCHTLQAQGQQWLGTIQDISITGVRVEATRRFEPGTILGLVVYDMILELESTHWAKVCWVRQLNNNFFSMGCSFNRPLKEDELNTFLDCGNSTIVISPKDRTLQ